MTEAKSLPVPAEISKPRFRSFCDLVASPVEVTRVSKAVRRSVFAIPLTSERLVMNFSMGTSAKLCPRLDRVLARILADLSSAANAVTAALLKLTISEAAKVTPKAFANFVTVVPRAVNSL